MDQMESENWMGRAVDVSVGALAALSASTGFVLPEAYSQTVTDHAGMSLRGGIGYHRRLSNGSTDAWYRHLEDLLLPVEGEVPAIVRNGIFSNSIAHHAALFDEFVLEKRLGPFFTEWRKDRLLIFRNSNPQTFTFLDFGFDPVDPPLVFVDTSDLYFNRFPRVPRWEGFEYLADSFSAMLAASSVAYGFEEWESYELLPPPSEKAVAWWDWRDEVLKPYEESASAH